MKSKDHRPTVSKRSGITSYSARNLNYQSSWLEATMRSRHAPAISGSNDLRPARQWPLVAGGIFILLISISMVRIFGLQIARGDSYLTAANGNRIQDEIAYAPRGTVYDRNGKVLARNSTEFQLAVIPYLLPTDSQERSRIYGVVGEIIGLADADIQASSESEGRTYTRPLRIAGGLSHTQLLLLEQALPDMPGFSLDSIPVREYTAKAGLAHILGYVGKASKDDLAQRTDLFPTDYVGRTGIEAVYDDILRGTNGRRRTEVDALMRPVRLLANEQAHSGTDIRLTIDYELQVRLERELQTQLRRTGSTRASGLAVDPMTGEVLAMVSIPYYDNNLFAKGISPEAYRRLEQDPDKPLFNRVIAGTYPSGSTIKPLVAAAALQEGTVRPNTVIVDRGFIDIPNQYNSSIAYRFRGWRPGGLGPMDVRRALAYSSNIYFYTVGGGHGGIDGLGANRLAQYYRGFGLGQKTSIDLLGENGGHVPTPDSKLERTGTPWYLGDTYNISIGQGDLRVTPLQMLMAHATIANGGKLLEPHVLYQKQGQVVSTTETSITAEVPISDHNLSIVRAGMHDMPYRGVFSARRFAKIPVQIAGKTGTAQASNPDGGGHPHGWFIAFAPYKQPKISILALVENVEGSTIALDPIINTLTYFFDKK